MKGTKKRGRKKKKPISESPEENDQMQNQSIPDRQIDYDSDRDIVRIKVENDSPNIQAEERPSKHFKKYKILLDPTVLVDDDMHGGVDIINSTILKSESGKDNMSVDEEHIQRDVDMEDDNNKVVIK